MDLRELNKQLKCGSLPDELNFTLEPTLDLSRLLYNAFYRSYEFHESKFPAGYDNIPGFDLLIQNIADNAKTPLEEIETRQQVAKSEEQ
jgi:hypothetical protein